MSWEQLSLYTEPPLKIKNKVRLIELFSGIGAQAKALERLGIDFEHWRAYDIDKYAVASYNAIHGTQFEVEDITKIHADDLGIVDRDKYTYIMTYSFPCQDLSLSGKQEGMTKGSGTRSSLLWEVERLLKECAGNLPQVLLMENVSQVISAKNKAEFDLWRESLRGLGYSNDYQLMNSRDFLVPQNRERCFMLSWLGEYIYEFPEQLILRKRLKDLLEDNAEEKYYLKETTADLVQIPGGLDSPQNYMRIKEATQKGYKEAYAGDYVNLQFPQSTTRRGRVGEQCANTLLCNDSNGVVVDKGQSEKNNWYLSSKGVKFVLDPKRGMITDINPDVAITLTVAGPQKWRGSFISDDIDYIDKTKTIGEKKPTIIHLKNGEVINSNCDTSKLKIRKLTPKECFRLMDFDDVDYEKASRVVSNTQLYKQAGNSIVVNVLVAILGQLFEGKEDVYRDR